MKIQINRLSAPFTSLCNLDSSHQQMSTVLNLTVLVDADGPHRVETSTRESNCPLSSRYEGVDGEIRCLIIAEIDLTRHTTRRTNRQQG